MDTGTKGGMVGVAKKNKSLDDCLGNKGGWALATSGNVFLDSHCYISYFPIELSKPCKVSVHVNI